MNKYINWSDLQMKRKKDIVPPFQSLRPGNESVRQFSSEGHTLLAAQGAEPYGTLPANRTENIKGLLKAVEVGPDYTVFEVPEESIALRALTLGTGSREIELLEPTYRNVGRTVTRIYAEGINAPHLSIDDIAIGRRTGEVYLMPPVELVDTESGSDPTIERPALRHSLESLGGSFPAAAISRLQDVLDEGLRDAQ